MNPNLRGGSPSGARFAFPKISRVRLSNFSLYKLEPNARLDISSGVHCLAGANGIGKSTFLATVNYGLTGCVPDPQRRFLSAERYVADAHRFTQHFFDGRISEDDRELAAVTLEFSIDTLSFVVTRGLFSATDVRHLEIIDEDGLVVFDGSQMAGYQRAERYKEIVSNTIGLKNFDQFVFLQHFVFTFDESRHLLFWDDKASSQVLFLTFGGDPEEAARADQLKREADQEDSRARNAQYQANNTRKRIRVLREELGRDDSDSKIEALVEEYNRLRNALNDSVAESERAETKLNEAELKFSRATATYATYRAAYADAFNRAITTTSNAAAHPIIIGSIADHECAICHAKGAHVAARIEQFFARHLCPLCESDLPTEPSPQAGIEEQLRQIDERLSVAKGELEEADRARARLNGEHEAARARALSSRDSLSSFETQHGAVSEALREYRSSGSDQLDKTIASLNDSFVDSIAVRDRHYSKRDSLRGEYKALQEKLERSYASTEQEFVPRFRDLAKLFLGIDLSVGLVERAATELRLEIELNGDARDDSQELSESQRFFIDIALRMSLAQQMAGAENSVTLFIDTPEGSLDIAYENQAGEMFARFVEGGHNLLMTANINTSLLLKTMATRCGASKMALTQMTDWTELTDVQQAASHLFQQAYSEISLALGQRGGGSVNP